jgi:PTS system fructose-specific IIC component
MLDALGRAELVPSREVPKLFTALLEREKLGSTGIGNGYAIPHVKHGSVKDLEVALGISRYGIDFNSIDGEPVTHVFLIVANPEAPEEYLRLLQWIAKIARNQDFTRFLRNAKDVPEILSLLREMSE